MALPGKAALAMWWDMAPGMRAEFEDWHSHEHVPERLAIPRFRRATRWSAADGGEGVFQMYELGAHPSAVLIGCLQTGPRAHHLKETSP